MAAWDPWEILICKPVSFEQAGFKIQDLGHDALYLSWGRGMQSQNFSLGALLLTLLVPDCEI